MMGVAYGGLAALVAGAWTVAAGMAPLSEPARRMVAAVLVVLAYVAFCGVVALRRRTAGQMLGLAGQGLPTAGDGGLGQPVPHAPDPTAAAPLLIAYASQTGFAEQLAWQTAESLHAAGMAVRVVPLSALDAARLAATPRALFVVSTTGEGDAPDTAVGFARRVMRGAVDLHGLSYGVLSLGDRSYAHYCAFGSALDGWLHRHGAKPLFDTVQVDNGSAEDLRHWQHYLGVLSGSAEMADWTPPAYAPWRLSARTHLNPGSPGGPAFLVSLVAVDAMPSWRAGDIAEIGPRQPDAEVRRVMAALGRDTQAPGGQVAGILAGRLLPHDAQALAALAARIGNDATNPQGVLEALPSLPHREYSIASLPEDGTLQLLVRQTRYPDGRLGLGSGWLTAHAPVGATIELRIRENRSFHPPADDRPMILIGNGTGLAGLRAHLKARARAGRHRNWLLFGERTLAHDQFFADELAAWQQSGVLARLDRVFSRDGNADGARYVQERLAQVAQDIRQWVDDGAAIYVCGSLQGMASGVAEVLTQTLGDERIERLAEAGRYRRDVY
ncbi:sulfite reductase subunit alpha [Pigmentiphaga litoralis]|uniref:sulfite reductase subunit alpha n=1 Tax=Pigmentiphaga litoralis TaxID=516702 RepID=UPI003B42ECC2